MLKEYSLPKLFFNIVLQIAISVALIILAGIVTMVFINLVEIVKRCFVTGSMENWCHGPEPLVSIPVGFIADFRDLTKGKLLLQLTPLFFHIIRIAPIAHVSHPFELTRFRQQFILILIAVWILFVEIALFGYGSWF